MTTLVRSKASITWLTLAALTVMSSLLGGERDLVIGWDQAVSLVVLAVAVLEVRLIGMHFMGLRDAPVQLRTTFDIYCVLLLYVIGGMFVWG